MTRGKDWLLLGALTALATMPQVIQAQRVSDLRTATLVRHRAAATSSVTTRTHEDAGMAQAALYAAIAPNAPPHRRALWPWFALGGAVTGASSILILAAKECDAGCRDDGGWEVVPVVVAGAAVIGAGAGALIGVAVDAARHRALASSDR